MAQLNFANAKKPRLLLPESSIKTRNFPTSMSVSRNRTPLHRKILLPATTPRAAIPRVAAVIAALIVAVTVAIVVAIVVAIAVVDAADVGAAVVPEAAAVVVDTTMVRVGEICHPPSTPPHKVIAILAPTITAARTIVSQVLP